MSRLAVLLLPLFLLVSCENTNLLMMTDAASDAVTAMTLSDEDVRRLSRQAAAQEDSKHRMAPPGSPDDTRLRRLVDKYGQYQGRSYNFKVYLTHDINAFAMADGSIRIYSGLMELMNDQELLFVIGHEMGHVALDHSRKKVMMAYAASAVKKGLAAQENHAGQLAGSVLGDFAEQLVNAQFSQHEERRADDFGAAFLENEGHDRAAAVSALSKLAELAKRHTFLSSHPEPEKRAQRLLRGETAETEETGSWLGKLLEFVEKLLLGLINLVMVTIKWLLSLL
jgi:putative metalloprotease